MRFATLGKQFFTKIISLLSSNKVALKLINEVYERMPSSVLFRVEPWMPVPKVDYTWRIHLENRTLAFTYKKNEPRNIYHFPLSYKKNDYPIQQLERIIHRSISPEKLFFDLGANFGLRSLYYISQGRTCHLFEPNEICNNITERLIKQNNLSNVIIVPKAVGPNSGEVQFYRSISTYLSSVNPDYPNSCGDLLDVVTKQMTSVDDYVNTLQLNEKVGIIKIDVEGYENEVCAGASKLLRENELVVLIEVTTTAAKRKELYSQFHSHGYRAFAIKPSNTQLMLEECNNTFTDTYFDFVCTNNKLLIAQLQKNWQP